MKLSKSALLLASLLGFGCATKPPQPPSTPKAPPAEQQIAPPISQGSKTDNRGAAEFLLRRGELEAAAVRYAAAALASADPAVSERATSVAIAAGRFDIAAGVADRWATLEPGRPLAIQAQITAAIRLADIDAARRHVDRLLSLDEPAAVAERWRLLGQALVGHPDAELPQTLLRERIAKRNALPDAASLVAASAIADALALPVEAGELAERAVRAEREGTLALIWRAQRAIREGDYDGAISDYARALERTPNDETLGLGYAALLSELDRNGEALAVASALPESPRRLLAQAIYADAAQLPEQALGYYRKLEAAPAEDRSERAIELARLARELDLADEALNHYERALADDPSLMAAQLGRIEVLHETGRERDARAALAALKAPTVDEETRSQAWLLESELARRSDGPQQSVAILDRAIAQLPNAEALLYARGLAHANAGDVALAERDLRRVLAINPESGHALNALGYTLTDLTDRHQEALGYLEQAIARLPDDPAVIDSMGWVQFRLGRIDKARRYLQRAYMLSRDQEIAAHLVEVLVAAGQRAEAQRLLAEALQREPDGTKLLEVQSRLALN